MFRVTMAFAVGLIPLSDAVAGPVAIIEEIDSPSEALEQYSLLDAGTQIKLPDNGTLILSFLASCERETISGGTLVIGELRSQVNGGKVTRETLNCQPLIRSEQAAVQTVAAPMTFRRSPGTGKTPPGVQEPALTVFNTAPAFLISAAGELTIERLDQPSTVRLLNAKAGVFDLRKENVLLFAGGIYKASLNGKEVIFRIDPQAQEGPGPLLMRLIRM